MSVTIAQPVMPVAAGPNSQPAGRLGNPRDMYNLITAQAVRLRARDSLFRLIGEAYDRVPKDSPARLQADGLGWSTSLNWGGMETGIDEAVETYLHYSITGETALDLRVRGSSQFPRQDRAKWLRIIAEEDKEMLDEWPSHNDTWEEMLHFRAACGMGFFYWSEPEGWHWKTTHPSNFLYPALMKRDPKTWPWVALKNRISIQDLVQKLKNEDAAQRNGWETGNIKRLLRRINRESEIPIPMNFAANDGEQHARGIDQRLDFFSAANNNDIECYTVWVREWSGKISERLLCHHFGDDPVFLYRLEEAHEEMPFVPFYASVGQGLLERVRGYGEKMLAYHDMLDRLQNHIVDVTWLASGLMVQGGGGNDLSKLLSIVFGPVTLLPDNMNVIQQSFANPAGNGLLQVKEDIERQAANRNAPAGGKIDLDSDVAKTAFESRLRFEDGTKLKNFDLARHRRSMDHFCRLRWLRTVSRKDPNAPGAKDALEMLNRTYDKGVPPEFLREIDRVRSFRVFGGGDPVLQALALNDVQPHVLRHGSAEGNRQFARQFLTVRLGDHEAAELFLGDNKLDDTDSLQRHMAQVENSLFSVSDARVDVTGNENHLIHAGEHIIFLEEQILLGRQRAVPPEQTFKTLDRGIAHMQGDENLPGHLLYLANNDVAVNSGVLRDIMERFGALQNERRKIGSQLQAARQAAAQQAAQNGAQQPQSEQAENEEKLRHMREENKLKEEKLRAEIDKIKSLTAAQIEAAQAQAQVARAGSGGDDARIRPSERPPLAVDQPLPALGAPTE